jgi:hypothetical protein
MRLLTTTLRRSFFTLVPPTPTTDALRTAWAARLAAGVRPMDARELKQAIRHAEILIRLQVDEEASLTRGAGHWTMARRKTVHAEIKRLKS